MIFDSIDPLIVIQTEEIIGVKILTGINFNLRSKDLEKIIQQKNSVSRLKFSPELLNELRYYTLLQDRASSDFALTFTTYYVQRQQRIAVIKTIISLQGKISQQICRSFLAKPLLLNDLLTSHYWLIKEICDRLSLKYHNKSSLLAWSLASILVLIIAPILFYFLALNWIIKLLILVSILGLFYLAIKLAIKKYLPAFILQQLLFGFFSKTIGRRHLGFRFLRYFG